MVRSASEQSGLKIALTHIQALGQAGLLGQNDLGLCERIGGVKRESFPAQLANSTGSEKQHVVFFFLYDPFHFGFWSVAKELCLARRTL